MPESQESHLETDHSSLDEVAASICGYLGIEGAVTPDELRRLALDPEPEHRASVLVVSAGDIDAMDMGIPTAFERIESSYTGVALAGTYNVSRGRFPNAVPSDYDLWDAADLSDHVA